MRYSEINESIPLGKPVNTSGITIGFEAEYYGHSGGVPAIEFVDFEEIERMFYVDADNDLREKYDEWLEDNDGSESEFISSNYTYETLADEFGLQDGFHFDEGGDLIGLPDESEFHANEWDDLSHVLSDHGFDVVADSSLTSSYADDDTSVGVGCEFVSGILDWETFQKDFPAVMGYIRENGTTNENTGLHINIGFPSGKLDRLKLILMGGDEFLTGEFDRSDNRFAGKAIGIILNSFGEVDDYEITEEDIRKAIDEHVLYGTRKKDFAINFRHGYVEFRSMGGTGYERRTDFMPHIQRLIDVLQIASTDRLDGVFRKKVGALLQRINTPKDDAPKGKTTLERFVRQWIKDNRHAIGFNPAHPINARQAFGFIANMLDRPTTIQGSDIEIPRVKRDDRVIRALIHLFDLKNNLDVSTHYENDAEVKELVKSF